MVYQALYRVWRSQRFEDIVGQQTVTQTLKNAISQHKTSHAYLFTGPRGTGKTSAAKIFAKAINCPNQVDGEPCNQCEICQEITEGRLNDVIEIDAASNNGVDEIREIREKVKYAPTQATYKVYIIDEVHMLSTGAFNALLKTLEEPPKNVLFILATTEPHKIPATIISRTQRFDFKRISTEDIVTHLQHILNEMQLPYEEQSLYVLARAAEGGMRDALSLLDQALSFSEDKLTTQDALQVTGSLTTEMMDEYLSACVSGNVEQSLEKVQAILAEGKESSRFLEDLLLYCRDILVYQQSPQFLLTERGYVTEEFKELASNMGTDKIYDYIQLLNDTQQQLKQSTHSDIYLEVVTVKMASQQKMLPKEGQSSGVVNDGDIQQLQEQISALKKEVAHLKANGPSGETKEAAKAKPQVKLSNYRLPTEQVYQVLGHATREALVKAQEEWSDLLQFLSVTQRAMLKASQPVAASNDGLVIAFEYEIVCQRANEDEELKSLITSSYNKLIQYAPKVVFIPKESWGGLRKDFLQDNQGNMQEEVPYQESSESIAEEKNQQVVDTAVELFGEEFVKVLDE